MSKVLYIDLNRCIYCRSCEVACEREHNGQSFMSVLLLDEKQPIPLKCHHCEDAPCVKVCPLGALGYIGGNTVSIDAAKCAGCQLCVLVCPFGVPQIDPTSNIAIKCDQCYDRQNKGKRPACVTTCPSRALAYDEFDTLMERAKKKPAKTIIEGTEITGKGSNAILMEKAAEKRQEVTEWEANIVPCSQACPAGIDIPRYIRLIAQGRPSEALTVIREKVPFPAALGRICIHPCETACRHSQLNKPELMNPISIKALKRFAAEHDDGTRKQREKVLTATGRRVAIVGAGPCGLTAAFYLAKLGHTVTIFEALPELGGMMRVGIPEYRLPREILQAEIDRILDAGIEVKVNTRVESLDGFFQQGYHATLVALGAHRGSKMGIEGEDSPRVIECVDFLRRVALGDAIGVGNSVGVVGGGNAAIDSARTALRLGASQVTILYRRTQAEMPASPEEINEAIHEGIKILFLAAPNKIASRNAKIELECIRMKLGEPDASGRRRPVPLPGSEFAIEFDTVIAAIGQSPQVPPGFGLKLARDNTIQVDPQTLATSRQGVFAGGDAVSGPSSVIEAIAQGRKAASSIDKYLGGTGIIDEELIPYEEPRVWLRGDERFVSRRRVFPLCLLLDERAGDFSEVELGLDEEAAVNEARRCLRCDLVQHLSHKYLPCRA